MIDSPIYDIEGGKECGLCKSIFDRRTDLRAGADLTGPNEADAGAGHGVAGMQRRGSWLLQYLQAVSGFCRGRGERPSAGLWQRTVAGSEGGCG